MPSIDVTGQVDFQNPDDEALPLTRCVCGKVHQPWHDMDTVISIYADDPTVMPCCGARLYFGQAIRVYQVKDNA